MRRRLDEMAATEQDRRRQRVGTAATVACLVAVGATIWWSGDQVHVPSLVGTVALGGALGWTVRFPACAAAWDRVGPMVGAALIAALVASTGGADSNYQDVFLIVPVASALLRSPGRYAVAVVVTAGAALLPLLYDGAGQVFVSDTTASVAVWTAVGAVVLVQARFERRQEQALRRAEAVKSTFLRTVSHEIRTPMTVIVGVSKTLSQHGDRLSPAERAELIAGLESNAARLSSLVADLLDVDRLLRGSAVPAMTECDLSRLVADVVEDIASGERTIHVDMQAVPAKVDRPRIERAVEHLVVNAVRHTPDDARIWIRLRCRNGTARLVVEDDGQGVPDALKQRLFRPFEQGIGSVTAASPGMGLGLAYVAEVVRLHRGHVMVEDRPDGGARFSMELPTAVGSTRRQTDQA